MSLQSPRDMPVIHARPTGRGTWQVALPGGVYRIAASRAAVARLVAREAPYSAIAYESKPPTKR